MNPPKISDVQADGSVPSAESSSERTVPPAEISEPASSGQAAFDMSQLPPIVWLVADYSKRFGHSVPPFMTLPEAELVAILTKALATNTPVPGWEGQRTGCVVREEGEVLARLRRERDADSDKS